MFRFIIRNILIVILSLGIIGSASAAKKQEFDFIGPTGILGTLEKDGTILVHGTEPGSPADGKLVKGDVILSIGGRQVVKQAKPFHENLTQSILEAEGEKAGGKLELMLNGDRQVTLQLKVLGSFSPTAPYNCPKTDKIVTGAADALAKEVMAAKGKQLGTSHTQTELLGLMSTGEGKYQKVAYDIIKRDFGKIPYDGTTLQSKSNNQVGSWSTGYATIAMAEYYLLTKDPEILPALKTYTLSLVEGQDPAGLYGHKMADPVTHRAPGYGQMNSVSLACYMAMQLARKCGVDVPGLDEAIGRTERYTRFHAGRGTFPYGFHGPRHWEWNNNGTSAMAAINMAMAGDKEAAEFFASCSAASAESLGVGHASSLFSTYWTPAGVHVLGPEATQRFFPKTHSYFTPRRMWDGSISACYNEGHLGGVVLLAYCLPRKALVITGRDADESIWADSGKADAGVNMGALAIGDKSPEELIPLFDHPFPQIRSAAISRMQDMAGGKQFEKILKKNPKEAQAAKQRVADFFPKLEELLAKGTPRQRESAARLFLLECPQDAQTARMETLGAILRNRQEPDQLRVIAASQLASLGAACKPYFNDILRFLTEDRPSDHFGEIDTLVAEGLDPLARILEWDYYKAGFVTDHELFHQAAIRLMQHKQQNTRGTGARMVRFVPNEKFHLVARPLEHILKDDDTTYHTYHNPRAVIDPAVQVFADHDILEGVEYLIDYMLEPGGKSGFMIRTLTSTLPAYGIHAKPWLPKIRENKWIKVMHEQAANNNGEHRFLPAYNKMVSDIENATEGPPLVPLEEAIRKSKQADQQSTE